MKNKIEIVCGIDKNYVPHLAVMLTSLLATNPRHEFRVHILHDAVPEDLRSRVTGSDRLEIVWHQVVDHAVLGFAQNLHITRATYLRLIMLEVLPPTLTRVLYLDVDMIVTGDIAPLWNMDLQGKICGCVVDPGVDPVVFAQKWHLKGEGLYFNAGVMLYDLDLLRAKPYLEDAITILANPDNVCKYGDQDALNIVLWNNWFFMDPKWNFQRRFLYDNYAAWKELKSVGGAPAIIHFTESEKPWKSSEWHPCRWLYLKSLLKTPFKNEVLKAGNISSLSLFKSRLKWQLKKPPMFHARKHI